MEPTKDPTSTLPEITKHGHEKDCGGLKTTPIAALEAELGQPPADLRLDRILHAFTARLFTLSTKAPGREGLGFECIKMAYRAIPDYFHTL